MRSVAVIGGGWAGCAAAVALAGQGRRVTLYESAPVLGGRARTVIRDGLGLDNGQHLLLGGYTATRALARKLHEQPPLRQMPLALAPLAPTQAGGLALRARAWRAPLGLIAGLATARGLTLRERYGLLRGFWGWRQAGFRCGADETVASLLAPLPPAAAERLWAPLCIAALNTRPADASAQVFLNMVQATFDGARDAADLVLPTVSLGDALPAAAGRFLGRGGHAVRTTALATVGLSAAGRFQIDAAGTREGVDAVVVAVGPHQLARTFASNLAEDRAVHPALRVVATYRYESITTIYLGYRGTRIALPAGLVRLDDAPGQWVFDRGDIVKNAARHAPPLDQLLAVVISTGGEHDDAAQADLAAACDAQLRRGRPALPPLAWSRVIAERRATYACTPGLAHPAVRLRPGLYLAGDYVYGAFPATLEAAVRSGEAAAAALAEDAAAAGATSAG